MPEPPELEACAADPREWGVGRLRTSVDHTLTQVDMASFGMVRRLVDRRLSLLSP